MQFDLLLVQDDRGNHGKVAPHGGEVEGHRAQGGVEEVETGGVLGSPQALLGGGGAAGGHRDAAAGSAPALREGAAGRERSDKGCGRSALREDGHGRSTYRPFVGKQTLRGIPTVGA
ncbi:hypothetical protein ACIOMM_35715 [Streptomyces sp. NPDC087908]|uniref:hypothetical protein n=1 Tax=Streptomyces sp. NPDC087908 TaxID=3365820 RepID=UPI00381A3649